MLETTNYQIGGYVWDDDLTLGISITPADDD